MIHIHRSPFSLLESETRFIIHEYARLQEHWGGIRVLVVMVPNSLPARPNHLLYAWFNRENGSGKNSMFGECKNLQEALEIFRALSDASENKNTLELITNPKIQRLVNCEEKKPWFLAVGDERLNEPGGDFVSDRKEVSVESLWD